MSSLDQIVRQLLAESVTDAVQKLLGPMISDIRQKAADVERDLVFTRPEAAAYLKLAPTTLAVMAFEKRGPLYVKIGRSVRYRKSDLDAFLENNNGLIGHRGRPHNQPIVVTTNGSVHGRINKRRSDKALARLKQ